MLKPAFKSAHGLSLARHRRSANDMEITSQHQDRSRSSEKNSLFTKKEISYSQKGKSPVS